MNLLSTATTRYLCKTNNVYSFNGHIYSIPANMVPKEIMDKLYDEFLKIYLMSQEGKHINYV